MTHLCHYMIIIINIFACCNIPFCCCSYNKITRPILKKVGDINSRHGEQDEQCMMDCHVVSSSKQPVIIHFIDSVGDHRLYLNPGSEVMKDVGMVSVSPMLCMTWTQQVWTLLLRSPHPPNHQRCILSCGLLPARKLFVLLKDVNEFPN